MRAGVHSLLDLEASRYTAALCLLSDRVHNIWFEFIRILVPNEYPGVNINMTGFNNIIPVFLLLYGSLICRSGCLYRLRRLSWAAGVASDGSVRLGHLTLQTFEAYSKREAGGQLQSTTSKIFMVAYRNCQIKQMQRASQK